MRPEQAGIERKNKMNVCLKTVLDTAMRQIPDGPLESGGIMGGTGRVVTQIVLDRGRMGGPPCRYTPDVDLLNHKIREWAEKGIQFMGMFHVHFGGAETLSIGDKAYIVRIMDRMPEGLNRLYFPIVVMPERRMIAYQAVRRNEKIEIKRDEIRYQGGICYED